MHDPTLQQGLVRRAWSVGYSSIFSPVSTSIFWNSSTSYLPQDHKMLFADRPSL